MIITYGNLAVPGVTVSASSTSSGYAASNILNPHKSKIWRTGTSTASEWIELDFGAAVTVTHLGLVAHNFTGGDTIRIKGNASSSWGSPSVNVLITVAAPNQIVSLGGSQSYRYWRLEVTKASSGVTRELGALLLGSAYTFAELPAYDGYSDARVDPSRNTKAIGGQEYSEVLPKFSEFSMDWSMVDSTMATNIRTVINSLGVTQPCLLTVDAGGELTEVIYAKLRRLPRIKAHGADATLRWDFSLDLEEML